LINRQKGRPRKWSSINLLKNSPWIRALLTLPDVFGVRLFSSRPSFFYLNHSLIPSINPGRTLKGPAQNIRRIHPLTGSIFQTGLQRLTFNFQPILRLLTGIFQLELRRLKG
jgi:hypothetical protein